MCGALSFKFIAYSTSGDATFVMTNTATNQYSDVNDPLTETMTLSILTSEQDAGGNYKVKVVGSLDCTSVCPGGTCLTASSCTTVNWSSFKLNIVNVCSMLNPCSYTVVKDNLLSTQTDMFAYVDGQEVRQTFTRWSDKVSGLGCPTVPATGCTVLVYKLIYSADLSTVDATVA